MSKAVIYIDIEDDITSIIDRVKASESDIVALVPPKRVGVLQSIVNLKLLKRAAASAQKRVVLITNDQALTSLAGGVKIPTAKNLQSRPEVAPISALEVDHEDVINGEELSVGEMDDALNGKKPAPAETPASAESAAAKIAPAAKSGLAKKSDKLKNGLKVPDFMKFRKKLFIIIGAVLALIILLWWAFWIAPHATVAIKAKTEIANIDRALTLDPSLVDSKPDEGSLKPQTEQIKKNDSVEFTATGKKEVGEKASGQMQLQRTSVSSNPISVPAGTSFSSGNITFVSTEGTTLAGTTVGPNGIVQDSATVSVQATNIGAEYNLSARGYQSSVGGFDASGTAMSGGSKRQITVVSDSDVAKAKEQAAKADDNAAKAELVKKFDKKEYQIISETFRADVANPSVSPAVGQEASEATLTTETTYTLMAVNVKDLNKMLDEAVKDEIGNDKNKSVYDNGREEMKVSEYQKLESGKATMRIKTTGYIGAKIDEEQLKKDIVGKRYGEIEARVKEIPNVESVDVKFSPFWVSSAPAADKIEIKFDVSKNDE